MQQYAAIIQELSQAIGQYLLVNDKGRPSELYEPIGYILSLGGKRLRPLLCLAGCDVFDKPLDDARHAALAIELFHNFSLIHDDILDQAPLRRGKQTVHEKWNTNIAILSGDGMLVKSFESLCACDPAKVPSLLRLFSETAMAVCEGQQLDMNFETQQGVTVDDYIRMITGKTAVLLGCSLQMGAVCAGADAGSQAHLYEFGKHIGIAFQLMDDVLDVYASDKGKFGKQVGGDILANKKTFLLLKAFELANPVQRQALDGLLADGQGHEKVSGVMALYDQLHIKQLALAEADLHTQNALQHLEQLKAGSAKKQHLKEFALQLLNREV